MFTHTHNVLAVIGWVTTTPSQKWWYTARKSKNTIQTSCNKILKEYSSSCLWCGNSFFENVQMAFNLFSSLSFAILSEIHRYYSIRWCFHKIIIDAQSKELCQCCSRKSLIDNYIDPHDFWAIYFVHLVEELASLQMCFFMTWKS